MGYRVFPGSSPLTPGSSRGGITFSKTLGLTDETTEATRGPVTSWRTGPTTAAECARIIRPAVVFSLSWKIPIGAFIEVLSYEPDIEMHVRMGTPQWEPRRPVHMSREPRAMVAVFSKTVRRSRPSRAPAAPISP